MGWGPELTEIEKESGEVAFLALCFLTIEQCDQLPRGPGP